MLSPIPLAPGVEMMLLKMPFAVVMPAVGVLTFHGQSILSPPTVHQILYESSFCGLWLATTYS